MKTWMKIVLGILAVLVVVTALNWSKISRLMTVNSLFEDDVIVDNFSNMERAFFTRDLELRAEPYVWPEGLVALPETVSVSGQMRDLDDELARTKTTGLVVVQDGTIVAEAYFLGTERGDPRISWSVAKSFLSAMFGREVAAGRIDLDATVETYVPELAETAYAGASVRDVLNMSSGVGFNEDYFDRNSDINRMGRVLALGGSMDGFTLAMEAVARAPGTQRQYVSIDTHVLGMILRRVTGVSAAEYWERTYGDVLGFMGPVYYTTDGEDTAFVLGGLNMPTRDYALFGQLILQGGLWRGQEVVPADWIAASTVGSAQPPGARDGFDYGYQWWVPEDSPDNGGDFLARGIYGQYIYVNPGTDTVIVKNSAFAGFRDAGPSGRAEGLEVVDVFRDLAAHYASAQ